jgi:predicted metal-binding membrane protein
MDGAGPVGRGARRRLSGEDGIVLGCVALASGLAWAWLLIPTGGGMAMGGALDVWSVAYLGPAFAMWGLMMVAMMLPSAAPMILLHRRVARGGDGPGTPSATVVFALAYSSLWIEFSALATAAQAVLVDSGIVSRMSLRVGDARLAGLILLLAAGYNLSAAKRVCLDKCRSPLDFVVRRWRSGIAGALRMGLAHGLFCLGCCWALMLLLFVGGVMNLAWVAGLSLVVLAEKYGPPRTRGAVAALLAAAAVALLVVG